MSYRTKFSLINPEREEMFTNLLRVVKQWAIGYNSFLTNNQKSI